MTPSKKEASMIRKWATLRIWQDRFIFAACNYAGDESCRPATVLFIGIDEDLHLTVNGETHSGRCFLIGPNVHRSLDASFTRSYSLNLDPKHLYCRALSRKVNETGLLELTNHLTQDILKLAENSFTELEQDQEYRNSQLILDALFPDLVGTQPIDIRIRIVSDWILKNTPTSVNLSFLAGLCGLSESRLAHLFTEQMGLSIRQYLLWTKMRSATEMLVRNTPLLQVAHEAGFSDSSHFSRTYTKYFALKPSLLANDDMVKLQICD